jgi:hypothetical protein
MTSDRNLVTSDLGVFQQNRSEADTQKEISQIKKDKRLFPAKSGSSSNTCLRLFNTESGRIGRSDDRQIVTQNSHSM